MRCLTLHTRSTRIRTLNPTKHRPRHPATLPEPCPVATHAGPPASETTVAISESGRWPNEATAERGIKGGSLRRMSEPPPRLIRDARDAEEAARDWMRHWGFRDAELTGRGSDGGIDVDSGAAVAQVKAEMKPIGRPTVQQLNGIAAAEKKQPIFFSLSRFTPDAEEWANKVGVAWFRFDLQGQPEAKNQAALRLIKASHQAASNRVAASRVATHRPNGIDLTDLVVLLGREATGHAWRIEGRIPGKRIGWTLETTMNDEALRLSVRIPILLHEKILRIDHQWQLRDSDWIEYRGSRQSAVGRLVRVLAWLGEDPDAFELRLKWWGKLDRGDMADSPSDDIDGLEQETPPAKISTITNRDSDGRMYASFPKVTKPYSGLRRRGRWSTR